VILIFKTIILHSKLYKHSKFKQKKFIFLNKNKLFFYYNAINYNINLLVDCKKLNIVLLISYFNYCKILVFPDRIPIRIEKII